MTKYLRIFNLASFRKKHLSRSVPLPTDAKVVVERRGNFQRQSRPDTSFLSKPSEARRDHVVPRSQNHLLYDASSCQRTGVILPPPQLRVQQTYRFSIAESSPRLPRSTWFHVVTTRRTPYSAAIADASCCNGGLTRRRRGRGVRAPASTVRSPIPPHAVIDARTPKSYDAAMRTALERRGCYRLWIRRRNLL